jgi:protoporphyrinogen oxidase
MKIAIIGAGIGGLTAAFNLVKAGHTVTIFERENKPGGLAGGFKKEEWDWSVENFYHHWFWTDKPMLNLIKDLGLSEKVVFRKPKTVVYHSGDFFPLDSVTAVLKFPGFTLMDKLRFGIVTAYLKYLSGWRKLEKFTAVDWIKRYYGENLFKIFFEPLLIGKFNDNYLDVNMAWMWARFKARSAKLGTYRGGFQQFLDDFTQTLSQKGVEFKFNTTIAEITPNDDAGLTVKNIQGVFHHFDQVLVTTPPPLLAKMVPMLPVDYRNKIQKLKGTGAIVMVFALKRQLSEQGYYWYNMPKSAGFPFLALVEHTNFVSSDHFDGNHIVYCGDYLDSGHPYFSYSESELADLYLTAFNRINPEFSSDWIIDKWLFKAPFAQPIPFVNHSKNLAEIRTPIKGLFLASMSQIYPWDRGTNYAVSFAHQATQMMLDESWIA